MKALVNHSEYVDIYQCAEEAVILEPNDVFSNGIVGFMEKSDGNVPVYGYHKLVNALAQSYIEAGDVSENDPEDAEQMAIDWIEFNTIRSLPYIEEEHRPVIIYEVEE